MLMYGVKAFPERVQHRLHAIFHTAIGFDFFRNRVRVDAELVSGDL